MTRPILFLLIAVYLGIPAGSALALDAGRSAVVVMYHRFGEDQIPSTNIRLEQFEEHLRILQREDVPVLPLSQIIDRLSAGETLPDRAVAITVDDAYKSVLTEAWPRLRAAGYPMTLFVSTDMVDAASPGVLSWDDIRLLESEGVEIAHHTATHAHLTRIPPEQVVAELERAAARFKSELGHVPDLFAYPYGEASLA
ncbi:MAG: polysaccharide deacetylase family protein, partial [Rhodospirillales bacterium]